MEQIYIQFAQIDNDTWVLREENGRWVKHRKLSYIIEGNDLIVKEEPTYIVS